jgi:hypothetical protein
MNKDYKLMAGLIPIILVLSIALYLFPDASGLKNEMMGPILNQTDNSSLNQDFVNSTPETQTDTLGAQNIQGNDNYYTPPDNTDTGNSDNTSTDPTNPDVPVDPTNSSIPS